MSASTRQARFMPDPKPGMPATVHGWRDDSPATVLYVNGDFVAVRMCSSFTPAGVCNAYTEDQKWEFQENPNGAVYWFKLSENGKYVQHEMDGTKGTFRKIKDGNGLTIGKREKYRDPHI